MDLSLKLNHQSINHLRIKCIKINFRRSGPLILRVRPGVPENVKRPLPHVTALYSKLYIFQILNVNWEWYLGLHVPF